MHLKSNVTVRWRLIIFFYFWECKVKNVKKVKSEFKVNYKFLLKNWIQNIPSHRLVRKNTCLSIQQWKSNTFLILRNYVLCYHQSKVTCLLTSNCKTLKIFLNEPKRFRIYIIKARFINFTHLDQFYFSYLLTKI